MKNIFRAFVAAALVGLAAPLSPKCPPRRRPPPPRRPTAAAPGRRKPAKGALLDINSASLADLQALKGIGDVRAKAIVAGRLQGQGRSGAEEDHPAGHL